MSFYRTRLRATTSDDGSPTSDGLTLMVYADATLGPQAQRRTRMRTSDGTMTSDGLTSDGSRASDGRTKHSYGASDGERPVMVSDQ